MTKETGRRKTGEPLYPRGTAVWNIKKHLIGLVYDYSQKGNDIVSVKVEDIFYVKKSNRVKKVGNDSKGEWAIGDVRGVTGLQMRALKLFVTVDEQNFV